MTTAVASWADRYEVTSVRGRIWSRAMVRKAALSWGSRAGIPAAPAMVDSVLDDHVFMRRRRGEIPARVVEAVWQEAWRRALPCERNGADRGR